MSVKTRGEVLIFKQHSWKESKKRNLMFRENWKKMIVNVECVGSTSLWTFTKQWIEVFFFF